MEPIVWDDSLSVGITLIDDQHKKWIEHLNAVAQAVESREGPTRLPDTLGFLVDYTDYHFSTEQKHMTANNYPGYEEHLAKHESLKKTLANLVADYEEEGPTHPLAEAIDTFLRNWLKKHILEEDTRLAAFLTEAGVNLDAS